MNGVKYVFFDQKGCIFSKVWEIRMIGNLLRDNLPLKARTNPKGLLLLENTKDLNSTIPPVRHKNVPFIVDTDLGWIVKKSFIPAHAELSP